jgi:hypothetical protein
MRTSRNTDGPRLGDPSDLDIPVGHLPIPDGVLSSRARFRLDR